mgnify:CR=1 FL=1
MKRFSWIIFLCAFFVMLAPPVWANTYRISGLGSNNTSNSSEEENEESTTVTDAAKGYQILSGDGTVVEGGFAKLNAALQSGDTIIFDGNTKSGDIILSGDASLDIKVKVEIKGDNNPIISGDYGKGMKFPVITISGAGASGTTVTGLRFTHLSLDISKPRTGGAGIRVVSADNIEINNCVFEYNKIGSEGMKNNVRSQYEYAGGGGIHLTDTQGTRIISCDFNYNRIAFGYSGGDTEDGGGGIDNLSWSHDVTLEVISCDFISNDRPDAVNGSGGAMVNKIATNSNVKKNTRTLTSKIIGSTFKNNKAGRYGGALFNCPESKDQIIYVSVDKCVFIGNKLEKTKNNGSFGGAICSYACLSDIYMTVTNSFFKGNTATNGAINTGQFGACGGAIAALTNGRKDENTGNVYTVIDGCRFEENGSYVGGAVTNWGQSGNSNMLVANSTFVGNKAFEDSVFSFDKGRTGIPLYLYAIGSAIASRAYKDGKYDSPDKTASEGNSEEDDESTRRLSSKQIEEEELVGGTGRASTTVINCTFYSNDAVYGGTIADTLYASSGGKATVKVIDSTFVNNTISADKLKNATLSTLNNRRAIDFFIIANNSADIQAYNSMFINSSDSALVTVSQDERVIKSSSESYNLLGALTLNIGFYALDSKGNYLKNEDGSYKIIRPQAITLDMPLSHCAIPKNAKMGLKVTSKDCVIVTKFANTKNPKKLKINVSQDVFLISSTDTDAKIRTGGLSYNNLALQGAAGSNSTDGTNYMSYLKSDILGVGRSETTPSIGAAEYGSFGETQSQDFYAVVGKEFTHDFKVSSFVTGASWSVTTKPINSADAASGKFTVTPTAAGKYDFKVKASGTLGTSGSAYDITFPFTLIATKPEIIVTISSTDNTLSLDTPAGKEKTLQLAIEKVISKDTSSGQDQDIQDTSAYKAVWISESKDKVDYITLSEAGELKVTTAAPQGEYSYPVTVTVTINDNKYFTGSADAVVKITVTEAEIAPTITASKSEVTVEPGAEMETITVSSTAGKNIVWTYSGTLPSGITAASSDTFTLNGKVAEDATVQSYPVKVTATNTYGNDSVDITIKVIDKAPTIEVDPAITVRKGVPTTLKVTTTGTNVDLSLSSSSWATLNQEDSTLRITAPTSVKTGATETLTLTAKNSAGEETADVTVTAAGSISGDNTVYTSGDYKVPVSRTVTTGTAGFAATASSVVRNGAGEAMMSIDITITAESSDLIAVVGESFETPVSVDVKLIVADNSTYTSYSYKLTPSGLPAGFGIEGDPLTSTDVLESIDITYCFTLGGKPKVSGDYAIGFNFDLSISGDIPVLNAANYLDVTLKVKVPEESNISFDVTDDGVSVTIGGGTEKKGSEELLNELQDQLAEQGLTLDSVTTINIASNVTDLDAFTQLNNLTTLDLTEAHGLELVDNTLDMSKFASVESLDLTGNNSSTLTTVTLAGSAVKTFTATNSNLTTINFGTASERANSTVTSITVDNTPITGKLDASGLGKLVSFDASECDSVTEMDFTGCPELTDVTANNNDNVETVTFTDCNKLTNVEVKGTEGDGKGIRNLNFDGCFKLVKLLANHNRIRKSNAPENLFTLLTNFDVSGQTERLPNVSIPANGRFGFGSIVFNDEMFTSSVGAAEADTTAFAHVLKVFGYDKDGTKSEGVYDPSTGEVTFTTPPSKIEYYYDTQSVNGAQLDSTISLGEPEEDGTGPGESSGGGGGCEVFGAGMFSAMIMLAAVIMKKR